MSLCAIATEAFPSQHSKGRSTRLQLILLLADRGGHNLLLSEWEGFGTATLRPTGFHERLGNALEVHEIH